MHVARTPFLLRKFPSSLVWNLPRDEKKLFLTFDDGPIPDITPAVLDILKTYDAKATFFCLGKNILSHPDIYQEIILQGHKTGNHTHNHLNGWKTRNSNYFKDILMAQGIIQSKLFRPPYGKIRSSQLFHLRSKFKVIMWEILSGDYNVKISPEKCLKNVILNAKPGSIIVFHDSLKASKNMLFALPQVLEHFKNEGFAFEVIPD